ncbi:D-hexose-6-phosphate mutarotase [Brenneria tiliae]|uniref:Putative glucose-6-phosphate 1-epimerase n=1 Tax=Brenneria tiliae TaxID=2914984 RepID=A0ABT0N0S3_9GAMM|nr:D-hexose-6-phosphate mutarotase [Brenneria tiliae]MCL2895700.1 D-hexose-6-phosphate mutarotase [Brenneria tiliae]MCL2900199.1 D-hexose-6-phosphate mutarotase [Brenneria tiliae]MCL2904314.1 D-hexose-6-phosphate mutarotase [Brenneria tiliae]
MNDKIFALPISKPVTATVSQRQLDQLPVIVVEHPQVRAAVALQGAHLLSWQPTGEAPVLWLSDNTAFTEQVAIRGGIPICFPWFGPFSSPNHGFARLLPWEFTSHSEDEHGVQLAFTLRDNAQTREYWPHEFTLIARFTLGKESRIELEAHGDYSITSALHTYFHIGDIGRIAIGGLGEQFIDKVNQGEIAYQQGDLVFTGRTDRIYTHPQTISVINDPALQRTIEVHHAHHSDVVSWNPGAELSHTIGDMTDDGYKTFVCVETARINQPFTATLRSPARLSATLRIRKTA